MTTLTLRAWARPAAQNIHSFAKSITPIIDQTWITAAPDYAWPCRGTLQNTAQNSGLQSDRQSLALAQGHTRIAELFLPQNTHPRHDAPKKANPPSYDPSYSNGSIMYYGLDGVCHNISNQILTASATEKSAPPRVDKAKGYALSTFFFSTYGLNHIKWDRFVADNFSGVTLPPDDFLPIMAAIIPIDKHEILLNIRKNLHAELDKLRDIAASAYGYDYFPELFQIGLKYLSLTELRLGTPLFTALFDKDASEDISWLHPEGELSPAARKALNQMKLAA